MYLEHYIPNTTDGRSEHTNLHQQHNSPCVYFLDSSRNTGSTCHGDATPCSTRKRSIPLLRKAREETTFKLGTQRLMANSLQRSRRYFDRKEAEACRKTYPRKRGYQSSAGALQSLYCRMWLEKQVKSQKRHYSTIFWRSLWYIWASSAGEKAWWLGAATEQKHVWGTSGRNFRRKQFGKGGCFTVLNTVLYKRDIRAVTKKQAAFSLSKNVLSGSQKWSGRAEVPVRYVSFPGYTEENLKKNNSVEKNWRIVRLRHQLGAEGVGMTRGELHEWDGDISEFSRAFRLQNLSRVSGLYGKKKGYLSDHWLTLYMYFAGWEGCVRRTNVEQDVHKTCVLLGLHGRMRFPRKKLHHRRSELLHARKIPITCRLEQCHIFRSRQSRLLRVSLSFHWRMKMQISVFRR